MTLNKSFKLSFALGALVILGACSTTSIPTVGAGTEAARAERATQAYVLDSGDQLRITVFGQPELTGEFEVDGEGSIAMPLIGEITVKGLSTRGLEDAITTALADGYLKDPRVNSEVINYRPYYILGEVNAPGEYAFTNGLTVLNAVAAAGGYTYRANQREIFIRSIDGAGEESYKMGPELPVQPGDTLRIGERLF